jgi:hypothetical protein
MISMALSVRMSFLETFMIIFPNLLSTSQATDGNMVSTLTGEIPNKSSHRLPN